MDETIDNHDYQSYLANLHKKSTPERIINDVIESATHVQPIEKTRIVAGEANEVYDATLPDASHVIVRISRKGSSDFLQEKWAIEQCEKIDIPVPEIILIKDQTINNEFLSFCVQKKIAGDPLERGAIDYHNLDPKLLEQLMGQAGEILSKIHSIPTIGFGNIDGQGQGKVSTFQELLSDKVHQAKQYLTLGEKIGFDPGMMEHILETLKSNAIKYKDLEPRLNHGDYGPKHLMVQGEAITGVLDWGEASGHSPVHDFARWDYWFGTELPIEWLKAGYSNKKLFGPEFDTLLYVIKLHIGLEVISWYTKQNFPTAVENGKKQLALDWEAYQKISQNN